MSTRSDQQTQQEAKLMFVGLAGRRLDSILLVGTSPSSKKSLEVINMLLSLGFVAAVAVLALIIVLSRSQSETRRADNLLKEREAALSNVKALQSKEREQLKKLEERAEELKSVKQDLAGLRKKHHSAQEEAKKLRVEMKDQVEERDQLLHARPAFEPVVKAKIEAPKVFAAPEAKPKREEPVASATDTDGKIAKLESEIAHLKGILDDEKKAQRSQRDDGRKLRYYAEQLRRIAVVSKSQVEALEDKVTSLGRQYYDAVSELAALKGEVVPPKPRPVESARPAKAAKDADNVSAQSLDTDLDNAARDAAESQGDATHAS